MNRIDDARLMEILSDWMSEFRAKNKLAYVDWSSLHKNLKRFLCETERATGPITDEEAIEHLQKSGWMAEHDRQMSAGNFAAIINNIMSGGNTSVSISFYPVAEGTGDD